MRVSVVVAVLCFAVRGPGWTLTCVMSEAQLARMRRGGKSRLLWGARTSVGQMNDAPQSGFCGRDAHGVYGWMRSGMSDRVCQTDACGFSTDAGLID